MKIIKEIICKKENKKIVLDLEYKKPVGTSNTANRLQYFKCTNQINCKSYKEKTCPVINEFKNGGQLI